MGAGLALLFAPQSGEDTRHDIAVGGRRLARRGRRLAHRGRDAWDDLRDELHDAWRRKREHA
jgi:gas vesicle protein